MVLRLTLGMLILFMTLPGQLTAQTDLAASLEVLSAGVEIKRVNTETWVRINSESLVGVGDSIRTDATGEARITFFEDGTSTELTPNTEMRIVEFNGDGQKSTISLEVLAGITKQQVTELIDSGSSYDILTPTMSMTVRGTDFSVRVEDSGRSALLTAEGLVATSAAEETSDVPPGFGIRSEPNGLSDVVEATSFEELDSALDGCPASVETSADVRLNVRLGPGSDFARVGSIDPQNIAQILGVTANEQWYRIPFFGGFGWISAVAMNITISDACPGIRIYQDSPTEDASLFNALDLSEGTAIVEVEGTSLRERPGTEFPAIEILEQGTVVEVIGIDPTNDWVEVRTLDGEVGWVALTLIQLYADPATLDVIEAEATEQP